LHVVALPLQPHRLVCQRFLRPSDSELAPERQGALAAAAGARRKTRVLKKKPELGVDKVCASQQPVGSTNRESCPRRGGEGGAGALPGAGHLDSAELFRRFAPFVANFLARIGVLRSDIDDLLQEVFLIAHRNGGYDPGPAKPTTYLASIAFRAATTQRRKRHTRSFVQTADEIVNSSGDDRHSPERHADQKRQLILLDRALSALDADKRAVFVMAELHGESVVAIAEGLGLPVDTTHSRLRAARRIFREAAAALHLEPLAPAERAPAENHDHTPTRKDGAESSKR
jgi:RNA polymerase sigma-70 factor (ECF subfamily)